MIRDIYYENAECKICGDIGTITYTRKINEINYEFVARCKCKKAVNFWSFKPYYCFGMTDSQIIEEKRKNLLKLKGTKENGI